MIKAFYTGVSGSLANQSKLNVISNNMANVNTEGFKKSKAEFADLLHNNIRGASTGSGSKIAKIDIVFSQGAPISTGNGTDFMVNGDGFFGITLEDETVFTRAGSFKDTITEDGRYLTYNGGYVLDSNEEPIEMEAFKNGEVVPAVFEFENNSNLEQIGGNLFRVNNEEAIYEISEEDKLMQGYLEGSTVDIAEEMINIIETQRAFQLNSNIIKTADEIEQIINSLRN